MKNFTLIAIAQVFSILTSFVIIKLHAIYFAPVELGIIAIVYTLTHVVAQLISGQVSLAIKREFSELVNLKQSDKINKILSSFLFTSLIIYIFMFVFLVIVPIEYRYEYIFGFAIALISAVYSLLISIYNVMNQRKKYLKSTIITLCVRLFIAASLVIFTLSVSTYLFVLLIGYIIGAVVITTSFYRYFKLKIVLGIYKEFWRLVSDVRLLYFTALPFLIIQISDKWFLHLAGYEELLGMHAVYQQLGFTPIVLITGVILKYIYPLQRDRETILPTGQLSYVVVILVLLLFVMMFTFGRYSDLLVEIFASKNFVSNKLNAVLYFGSGLFFSLAMFYQQKLEVRRLYKEMSISRIISGLLSLFIYTFFLIILKYDYVIDEIFLFCTFIFYLCSALALFFTNRNNKMS